MKITEGVTGGQEEEKADGAGGPSWADMLPDALAKIFSRLSLEDMLTKVPIVCRTWKSISQDTVCWQTVDLDRWSRVGRKPETMEKMIKLLVNRSRGCLREICAPNLANDNMLRAIASSGSLLQVLRIPYSSVTDDCVCQLTSSFPLITYLDISGCVSLSKASLESFGKNCRHITRLDVAHRDDDVAFTIAQYMPQLKHLGMVYGMLSNVGLKALLDRCRSLEHLDLRGCRRLNMDDTFVKEALKRMKVFYPPVVVEDDIYNIDESDFDGSDFYDYDSDVYDSDFDDGSDFYDYDSDFDGSDFYDYDSDVDMWGYDSEFEDIDDLLMDMHEEEINGTLYFWPDTSPSP